MNDQFYKPKKVTSPNDNLDRKAYLCITGLFCDSRAITDEIKYHDKTSNIDGFIQLIDEDDYPIGNIFVQAKTYKSKYKGRNKTEIPTYFIKYAASLNNEVCIFLSVESDANKIYWKYISDDYINDFFRSGVRVSHIYNFSKEEIITKENTDATIEQWINIVNDKKAQYQRKEKSAEDYITENISAFQFINTDFHTLQDSFIERKEIFELYKWIKEDLPNNEPNLKLLVGNAGMGKSVIIKKVIQKLEEGDIKCFAIKADRLQKPLGQTDNEQFEMLRITFASLLQEERAVLIIDQIDALSQYITNDRAILDNVKALIDLFSSNESPNNVRIIVSCRSFDLEFDPKLSLLSNVPKIEIKELCKDEVKQILNRLKTGLYEELDETTLSILQTPQHLNLFCKVYLGNKKRKYTSITDLYDELWIQTINLSNERINKSLAEQLLYELAITIYKEETLTPQWNYDSSTFKEVQYLSSQGLIQQFNNRTTFFHQSMYDYVFARYYTREKRSFIEDLLEEKKHQGLFVRSTINLVLDYERAKNDKQYKENVKTILFSGKIRPHIQLMFLWALSNRIEILPFEKKCVKELFTLNQPLFYAFMKRTFSIEWFNIITPLILNVLKTLKDGDIVYENINSYLWNHVQTSTGEVISLVDKIKDEITRNRVARNVLRATPDYSLDIVTKWYKIVCDNVFEKAIFLERALPSNPQFVIGNISELISYLVKNEKESGVAERAIEEVCNTLVKKRPDDIYP